MQELKRLLMLKLGATDWHKIRPHFPTGNGQRKNADWNHADNEAYRQAVETLCQRIKTDFPVRVNTTKINYCTQKRSESVVGMGIVKVSTVLLLLSILLIDPVL